MTDKILRALFQGGPPDPVIQREVHDAMWSDVGQALYPRVMSDNLIEVVTRAGLRSKNTREMVGYIRAYILTGSKP